MNTKAFTKLLFYLATALGVMGLLGSSVLKAQDAAAPPGKLLEVTGLTTSQENGNVSILLNATGNIDYTAFKLSQPIRLILDLPRMRQGVLTGPVEVGKGMVQSIHPMYFEVAEVLRLEIALSGEADYEITKPGNNKLLIKLQPVSLAAGAPPPSAEEKPVQAQPLIMETVAEVARGPLTVDKSEAKTVVARKGTGDPCDEILSGEKQKISFDFQEANLRHLVKMIAEISGINLILSPQVTGKVTMGVRDIPWNKALQMILRNNGLGRECIDNMMRIVPQADLISEKSARAAAARSQIDADKAEKLAQDMVTEVVRINHADLTALTINLKAIKNVRGKVNVDARTSTIILTDIPSKLDEMLDLIKTLDIQIPQVMIEARIVEVNRNFSQNLGIQWGGTVTRVTSNEFPNTVTLGPSTLTAPGFIVDLPPTVAPAAGIGLSLGSLSGNALLDIQLAALESQGKGRILSSPKVTTLDNTLAKIQSGRSIPFQTVSQDGTQIEFVDASISLEVTPRITADGNIYLKIKAQKNAADFSNVVNGVPTITTKEAITEVMVRDGETTVLGGLYESNINESQTQVPFLSKIPFLNIFFKRWQESEVVNELLIFITPTIVKSVEPYTK